jgi:hypothetical protein
MGGMGVVWHMDESAVAYVWGRYSVVLWDMYEEVIVLWHVYEEDLG